MVPCVFISYTTTLKIHKQRGWPRNPQSNLSKHHNTLLVICEASNTIHQIRLEYIHLTFHGNKDVLSSQKPSSIQYFLHSEYEVKVQAPRDTLWQHVVGQRLFAHTNAVHAEYLPCCTTADLPQMFPRFPCDTHCHLGTFLLTTGDTLFRVYDHIFLTFLSWIVKNSFGHLCRSLV